MSVRLSVDIGGTFTDVVLSQRGVLTTIKVLTTYTDPAIGVMQGIEDVLQRSGVQAADIELVLHGTTLATNALIERRGAATALLTTRGHRDVLEMAFENRFEQYDVNIDRPQPLVPRHWRVGIDERVAADGEVLVPIQERDVAQVLQTLVDEGVEALAIGFLHSYANAAHEQFAADIARRDFPQLSLTLSSEVCPEIREYERMSTTAANAYVKPLMSHYLGSLAAQLEQRGITCQVLMMTSGGGLTTLQAAAEYPIRLVESGPAGGAILAAQVAASHDLSEVLSFDMGGTTAKICLIDEGEPQHSRAFEVDRSYRFKKGSGLPVRIPVIEMVEIGAGGGSIAAIDAMRRVQVGPESAGSEPGPACYGRGGAHATVTDADVILGKLSPQLFGGGKLQLDVERARQVIEQSIAQPLDMAAVKGANAVAEIVEENMASAARAHAGEWGKDVQGRCMIAFGGAAPLHAADLARKLKIQQVLVPAGAGVGSAIGFLLAPVSFEVVRSRYVRLAELQQHEIDALFEEMRREAGAVMQGAGPADEAMENREAYMRYVGQGYEVAVDISDMQALPPDLLLQRFEAVYQQLYGRTIPGMAVEILSWTLSLSAAQDTDGLQAAESSGVVGQDLPAAAQLFDHGRQVSAPIVAREQLQIGDTRSGPLLVVEEQTTTVVPSDFSVTVLADGTLSLQAERSERAERAEGGMA
jgi:N-methylhydantoinase A